jgi:hypothetical protein
MIQNAEIRGSGIAAQACCALLRRFGWDVNTPKPKMPAVPYLLINQATAALIRDVFGAHAGALPGHEISRRLVVPYEGSTISQVDETAWGIVAENLNALTVHEPSHQPSFGSDAYRIFAGEQPPEGALIVSGKRAAWIYEAQGRGGWEAHTAIFEATSEGWLFWAPLSSREGFLQLVLPDAKADADEIVGEMLARTRLLKTRVALGQLSAGPIPCAAGLHSQLNGPCWIASGTSALRYDPVSGDGTGASLRAAILACAVLRAVTEDTDHAPYLEHYHRRLALALGQHLRVCESLYRGAGFCSGWDEEIRTIRRLSGWNDSVSEVHPLGMRLSNYKLIPG